MLNKTKENFIIGITARPYGKDRLNLSKLTGKSFGLLNVINSESEKPTTDNKNIEL